MIAKDSPLKPYKVDNVYTSFYYRDPCHFIHILNYRRAECSIDLSTFQTNSYCPPWTAERVDNLSHLHCLLIKKIVDILPERSLEWHLVRIYHVYLLSCIVSPCEHNILHGRWLPWPTTVISVIFSHPVLQFQLVAVQNVN